MSAPVFETKLDFWPDEIRVDVLTPLALLRTQQGLLSKRTHGLLDAKVVTATLESEGLVEHSFYILAPALGPRHERLLSASHKSDSVYPVIVKAQCFAGPKAGNFESILKSTKVAEKYGENFKSDGVRADTDSEFIELLRDVFGSKEVISTIQSLIALSNERRASSSSAGTPEQSRDLEEAEQD